MTILSSLNFKKEYIQELVDIDYSLKTKHFSPSYWAHDPSAQKLSGGRGASYKIELDGKMYVLRRYLRGGMMSALLTDRYLWMGKSLSRPYMEHKVTQHALKNNLPVAAVAAYWLEQTGFFYRAAIITDYLENEGTLASLLYLQAMPRLDWIKLGQLIRKFHLARIWHADLNANNILVMPNENFYLIDFDKAKIKTDPGSWQDSNLNRLLRSLKKIQRIRQELNQDFHFSMDDWQHLLSGYHKYC